MSLLHPFAGTETKAKEPINEDLMDLKIRENLEDLAIQIDAIPSGGGGAGSSGEVGQIISGGETDEATYWKRRFHPLEQMLHADPKNPSGFDPEGNSLKNEMLEFIQSNDTGFNVNTTATAYLGQLLEISKDSVLTFKIKKGLNFFSFGLTTAASLCDNATILIDGATPTSLGLVDENGDAAPNTLTSVTAITYFGTVFSYYNLDGEEHTITIKNTDSASKLLDLEFVEVGYKSDAPTINEVVQITAGKASVRGSEVTFNEDSATFSKLGKNGHTGSIVLDKLGTLTSLNGESPAMTQAKPEVEVDFSSNVTQLGVKNNFYFPDNGICLLSTPYGNHHLFSYGSKTDAAIQSHTFNDLLWQSQPTESFIPLDNFSGAVGTATGDLNINYWGTAPILIDATNNKLDFSITIAGVTTTHVATIASGRYSANLVPLGKAVREALQTAKPLNGDYYLKYNSKSQLWNIFVKDIQVENFQLLFATGVSFGNSIHTTIGFADTDLAGDNSYSATIPVQHLCCKVLEKDSVFMYAEDPRIKYASVGGAKSATILDIENRLGIGSVRVLSVGAGNFMQIYVDKTCSALEVNFAMDLNGSMITYQIDDGPCLYLTQNDTTISDSVIRGRIITSLISFPRGSKKITIRNETTGAFELVDSANDLAFVGCRQYFTKPAYEKLTLEESVIKCFEISPVSLYATIYGHNAGTLYSPNASDDNINTITESGSWAGFTSPAQFNRGYRNSGTTGDFVDVNFTIAGDGGGVAMKLQIASGNSLKVAMFISAGAIVEATDRVYNLHSRWATQHYDQDAIGLLGLLAGTYTVRFKNEQSVIRNSGFVVYDTVPPQEGANTVTDINNTAQSICYPINVIRESVRPDNGGRVPTWLERSGYREGRVSDVNYGISVHGLVDYDDSASLISQVSTAYYGSYLGGGAILGNSYNLTAFMKSVSLLNQSFLGGSASSSIFIDGVQTLNNYDVAVNVKGGSTVNGRASHARMMQNSFSLPCTHSAGLVFNITNTRGLKNNRVIILDDGTNKEKAVIDSFIVGTSFTIKKSLTTVVAASVIRAEYQGFHNLKLVANTTGAFEISCFEYEPLKVTVSDALIRKFDTEWEKVSITHDFVANDDLYYPVHSDGVLGNWNTSTITLIKGDGNSFDFPQDLKNIQGIGIVKITSERLVPILKEQARF